MHRIVVAVIFLVVAACEGARVVEEATPAAPRGYSVWPVIRLDDASGCRRVSSNLWVRDSGSELITHVSACLVDEDGESVLMTVELDEEPWADLGWRRCDLRAGEGEALLRSPDCG